MTAFRIAGFSGLVPRWQPAACAESGAVATNCNLTSGDLRPRNGPLHVFSPVIGNDIKSMFRMEREVTKVAGWDKDVDVARSPVAGIPPDGSTTPAMRTTRIGLRHGDRRLGLILPGAMSGGDARR